MILLKGSLLEKKLWPEIKAKITVLTIERALFGLVFAFCFFIVSNQHSQYNVFHKQMF
jgi:hypothetical protein